MVSDPRAVLLKDHQKYSLVLKTDLPDGVYVVASPIGETKYSIPDDDDIAWRFNLSPHIGLIDDSLVWGLSGFDSLYGRESCNIFPDPETGERYLEVTPPGIKGSSIVLNLDERLGIIEEYDPVWQEVRPRFGLKPNASKRSIVLCFDGTSNHFSDRNTNVVKLVELLKKDDPLQQMVYYQPGVGTYEHPGLMTGLSTRIAAKLDEGIAWYLYQHIIDGYKYIMETYRAGDRISIFGFSRGAYTARALAGMLHSVGLLSRHNIEQVPFAYQVYQYSKDTALNERAESRSIGAMSLKPPHLDGSGLLRWLRNAMTDTSAAKNVHPDHFKMVFCTPVKISFLGVWDTVGSVGAFRKKTLPWIEYNPSVECFRQALALDETRANFIPSLWDHSRDDPPSYVNGKPRALEVWFKGGHTDVGGGAPQVKCAENKNPGQPDRSPDLSNISLRWMVRQCFERGEASVLFDPDSMRRYREAEILGDHSFWATKDEISARGEEHRPAVLTRFPELKLPELQRLSKASDSVFKKLGVSISDIDTVKEEVKKLKANHQERIGRIDRLDSFDITPEPYRVLYTSYYSILWWGLEILPIPKLSQRDSQRTSHDSKTAWCSNRGAARVANFRNREAPIRLHNSVVAHLGKKTGYRPAAIWYGEKREAVDGHKNDVCEELASSLHTGPEEDNLFINPIRAAKLFVGHAFMITPLVLIVVYGFPVFIRQVKQSGILPSSDSLFGMRIMQSYASRIMQGV